MERAIKNLSFETPSDIVTVYFLGDIHEGNMGCDERALKQAVKIIEDEARKNPLTFVVTMGDLIDCIIPGGDPRFNPAEIARKYELRDLKDLPRKQTEHVIKMLYPIRKQVIATVIGNHEEQYIQRHSFDCYDHYSNLFPNAEKIGYNGVLRFKIKHKNDILGNFDIGVNHGDGGGGMREGYVKNKIYDVFRWWDTDIHIMAHLHRLEDDASGFISLNHEDQFQDIQRLYGSSGCFLKPYIEGGRGYFEHKGRKLSDIGMIRAKFQYRRTPRRYFAKRLEKVLLGEGFDL